MALAPRSWSCGCPASGSRLSDGKGDGRLIYYSSASSPRGRGCSRCRSRRTQSRNRGNRNFALPMFPILGGRISPDGRLVAGRSSEHAPESLTQRGSLPLRMLDLAAGSTGATASPVEGDASFGMGLGVRLGAGAGRTRSWPASGPSWGEDGRGRQLGSGVGSGIFQAPPQRSRRRTVRRSACVLAVGRSMTRRAAPSCGGRLNLPTRSRSSSRWSIVRANCCGALARPTTRDRLLFRQTERAWRVRWFDSFAPGRTIRHLGSWTSRQAEVHTNHQRCASRGGSLWSPDRRQILWVSARQVGYQEIKHKASARRHKLNLPIRPRCAGGTRAEGARMASI